jgi:hypothetical protein
VCPLEAACPEDALVASITTTSGPAASGSSNGSSLPTRLAIFTTQLLSEAYSPILQALLVSVSVGDTWLLGHEVGHKPVLPAA